MTVKKSTFLWQNADAWQAIEASKHCGRIRTQTGGLIKALQDAATTRLHPLNKLMYENLWLHAVIMGRPNRLFYLDSIPAFYIGATASFAAIPLLCLYLAGIRKTEAFYPSGCLSRWR